MAMEKRMSSNSGIEVVASSHTFGNGTRFMRDGLVFTVIESYEQQGTQMRKLVSSTGDESFQSIISLRKDAANTDTNFAFLPDESESEENSENVPEGAD